MVMNLKNIIKEEMGELDWIKDTYLTLGDAWDDGLINRGDVLTLSGTLVDTSGRNPIEVDDLKIKIDKNYNKINASYFYLLNDKYAEHLGVESDYREEKLRFDIADGRLIILELIKANNINESDELDWVKDIEPRPPLKIGTCLTFKQYEEEEDWVEDEYGNMVDHGKMDWHIIGKFIDEYNDDKPTFKMVATDRMGEGREIWMEVEKVKELYDEGVYKPCKKQTYLKRIMREEIDDFDWVDSLSDRPLHNVTFKVKGYPETLYTIKDSGLRSYVKIKWVTNAGFMMDGDWSDGVEEESTYMRDAVNKFFKIGEWIPTDTPITESSDLDWVKKELSSEGPLDGIRFTIPKSLVPRKIRVIEDKDGNNEWVSVFWQTDDKDDIRSEIYPREMVERYLNDGWWRKIKRGLKEEDELEWIKDTSPNNIHISDLKKGMVVTLHHPGFSSLKNRKLTVDETWHDKEMGHCVHFKEMDKIQYPFGKDREPTIPGVYICEHLGVRFKLIDYPINESNKLDSVKDEPGVNDLLIEGKLNNLFKKFNMTQIKKELKERLDIDETSTKTEVAKKLIKYSYNLNLKLLKYELGAVLGGFVFYFLSIVLDVAGVEPFVTDGEPTMPHFILWGAGALLNVIRMVRRDLKEEDDLEWIKDQVNTKLAKNENWILVNDIDRESITEGHEIQEYLFDLGYSWGRSDSFQLGPKPLCIYAIYHFGHDTNFANRIYYQSGCRDADIRIANKDIASGKYMVYYWSDLKPKTITESDELDWIKNTIPNKWDYFEELIKDEPDVNIEKNEDDEWVDLKDAQGRRYFGSGFSTEYELEEDIKSNSLPDFLNAVSQHIEVSFQGYDAEEDEDYWDFLTLKEVLEKANEITQ